MLISARTLVGSRSVSRAPFSQQEDEKLLELVETHGEDFLTVGSFMEKRSPYQCSRRLELEFFVVIISLTFL